MDCWSMYGGADETGAGSGVDGNSAGAAHGC